MQKVPFCSFSLGRSATPHFERYHLLYQLDKFIKNTIWWGLCSVLYFQVFWFSSFFMLEFLLQFTSLVYKKILPKPTVLFLFIYLFLICQLSSFYSNPCCKRKQKRGLQIQKFFFFHCSYSRFALTNLICFYGTEKLCVRKACTFCKQTKEDGQGHRTAASKHSLKCTFLSPGLLLQYGVTSSLALYLILIIVFL